MWLNEQGVSIPKPARKSIKPKRARSRIVPPPPTPDSWVAFEDSLTIALADLNEDEFLVIERKNTNYFVQFAAQGLSGMRVEAAANVYQPRLERIPKAAVQHLIHTGWNPPTYVDSHEYSEPVDGSPNFYLDVAAPVPYEEISALAVEALRGAFGARHPGQ